MIRFFIALNAAILTPLSPAEAADAAVQLTQGERAAGYAVLLEDEDGSEVEIVGDFDLIRAEKRWA
jgi:hypothetical protein